MDIYSNREENVFFLRFINIKEKTKEQIDIKVKVKTVFESKPFTIGKPDDHVFFKKEDALSEVPIYIPDERTRFFFKAMLKFIAKETNMPLEVHEVQHPNYPLLQVSYNHQLIEHYPVVKNLLFDIMEGIHHASVEETEWELPPEETEEDKLDHIDENETVEFEFDLEGIGKEPEQTKYLTLEGEDDE